MAGPNRQWHQGDHGPTAWADRTPHPYCSNNVPSLTQRVSDLQKHGMLPRPEGGRDPFDKVTMELPGFDAPIPNCPVARIAAGLYEDVDDEIPWLLLLLKAEADSENVLKKAAFA